MALIVCLCRVKILQYFMLLSVAILHVEIVSGINGRSITETTMPQPTEKVKEQHLFGRTQM